MKYLIIGGVAGGATVAARLRRLDERAEIIIFEKGEHISYANCGLPYYIGDVIKERSNLLLQTPESFMARFNVDVRVFNKVKSITTENKSVEVVNSITGKTYTENYDKLIVSPGASPILPPITGIENPKVLTLRNVSDTDRIKNHILQNKIKKAVVVGAGFIGLEMAENLHNIGVETTVVEASNQVMNAIDADMATDLHEQFKQHNVGLRLGKTVRKFTEINKDSLYVELDGDEKIETQLVVFSIGVKPDSDLIKNAGIKTNDRGMIIVDEHMQTSDSNIFALGDAVLSKNKITKVYQPFFLAGPANKQARILANYLVKGDSFKYNGAIGTAIAKVFDRQAAITGLSEKAAQQAGIDYMVSLIRAGSHAGYYPGAKQMTLKLLFSPLDGRILGAQGVGEIGVDKRIDIIATAIGLGANIFDLQEIEHAYAPPFSSAKDPVNQLAFYAENIIDGSVKTISMSDFINSNDNTFVLDVRTSEEFKIGAIKGAINIPGDELRSRINEIPQDKKIVLYCKVGMRGYVASRILSQNGFKNVYNLSGGWDLYKLFNKEQSNYNIKANTQGTKPDKCSNKQVDARGLQCPGPIIKLKESIDELKEGEILEITASDAGFQADVDSWCRVTGNELIFVENKGGNIKAQIRKERQNSESKIQSCSSDCNEKTIVVFSDDLDKALASFVIANGAAAMGKQVTMFFTFWGLNIIKKENKPKVSKDFMGNMFSLMMPKSSKGLKLSKMKFWGSATMMRKRMKSLQVDSLEQMIQQAKQAGVKFIGCNMSMDVMGVDASELIDGVDIGGVANYLEHAENSNHNLFI